MVTTFDASTLLIACSLIKFGGASFHQVAVAQLYLGIVANFIYALIVPESPAWFFLHDGANSKRGIDALNYIAWVNGSSNRVPQGATFDLIGQAVLENRASVLGGLAPNAAVF